MKRNLISGNLFLAGTLFLASCGGEEPGITGVTRGPADLAVPQGVPEGETQRYGLGFPLQVGPKTAAILLNLRKGGMGVTDFENGSDVVLFDNLSGIAANAPIPLTRNDVFTDIATGRKRIFVKYPAVGGFVPLGAIRADGSPHPHAGSGFAISQILEFDLLETGAYRRDTIYSVHSEVFQFAYDGNTFRVVRKELYRGDQPKRIGNSDWFFGGLGLKTAIPDGDDLLIAGIARRGKTAIGVQRWQSIDGTWQPVSFMPVQEIEIGTEPSLARDADGALLFTIRIGRSQPDFPYIRVWRSKDAGVNWERIVYVPDTRDAGPVSVGRATDGTPFIVGNPVMDDRSIINRKVMHLWPLNTGRSGIEPPLIVRDGPAEFGPVEGKWKIDHPTSAVVRLDDGRWHCVLIYRVMCTGSTRKGGTEHEKTGLYVEEISSRGPAIPEWRFDN